MNNKYNIKTNKKEITITIILILISLLSTITILTNIEMENQNNTIINNNKYSKPSIEELKKTLTKEQFEITQNEKTEKAFENKYWDNKQEGIYVDIVTGEPLFSSIDKYDSGSGWPAFTKPIDTVEIEKNKDFKFGIIRTEVKSSAGSHLGHVFDDGPKDKGGQRFCINSGALNFIPKEKLKELGYQDYLYLFEK